MDKHTKLSTPKKRSTKDQLADALREVIKEKTFSKISVEDIVSKAGTSRQSFYRHFLDKFDCLAYIYKADIDNMRTGLANNDIAGLAVAVLNYFKEYSFIFKDIGCDFGSHNPFLDFWFDYTKEHLISNIGTNKLTPEINYAMDSYLHVCYYVHYEYITNRLPGDVETVQKIITRNMPEILKPYFKLDL